MVHKAICFIEMFCLSGLLGIVSKFMGSIDTAYVILLALMVIDTITGMSVAFKYKRFSSRGLCRLTKKVITYTTCIITVRLLEMGIVALIKTDMLSHLIIAFLQVTETVSILENLTMLGVPIPANLIGNLIEHLTVSELDKVLKETKSEEKGISEIHDMIRYQLPIFNDQNMRRLLEIKFEIWESVAMQINQVFKDNDQNNNELLYYKIMSLIEVGFADMEEKWKDERLTQDYIKKFKNIHQPKVDKWLEKVKTICYSNADMPEKRDQLLDSLVVILYQTIMDAHRGLKNNEFS